MPPPGQPAALLGAASTVVEDAQPAAQRLPTSPLPPLTARHQTSLNAIFDHYSAGADEMVITGEGRLMSPDEWEVLMQARLERRSHVGWLHAGSTSTSM